MFSSVTRWSYDNISSTAHEYRATTSALDANIKLLPGAGVNFSRMGTYHIASSLLRYDLADLMTDRNDYPGVPISAHMTR